jgi:transcriptional regulator with XRE-family HTH domain
LAELVIHIFLTIMHFGEQLKALRKQLNASHNEMADRLSIDKSTYYRWEKKELPSAYMLERVQKAFGVDAWGWMRPDDEESPTEPRLLHMRPEAVRPTDEQNEAERLRLIDRMLDLFERVIGRTKGGGGITNSISSDYKSTSHALTTSMEQAHGVVHLSPTSSGRTTGSAHR